MSASYDQITGLPTFYRRMVSLQPISTKTSNKNQVWTMCTSEERKGIALRCHDGHISPNTQQGIKQRYYEKTRKHDPCGRIPTEIYTLTPGTDHGMYDEYKQMYGEITRTHFLDYIRELKKQQIIIRSN